MSILKLGVAALVVCLVVAQAFRIDKSNPPIESDVSAPPQVKEVMRHSCDSCRSNEVEFPWYADVATASWLVAHNVPKGRRELNFSLWGKYSPGMRQRKLKEIAQTIAKEKCHPGIMSTRCTWKPGYRQPTERRFRTGSLLNQPLLTSKRPNPFWVRADR